MRQRGDGLETPQTIITRTIHDMGEAAERKYFAHGIMLHWVDIAGEYISSHTEPQGIRQGVLYLYCYDAPLRNELKMLEGQIVQKVNNYAGCEMIKSLAFTRRWENPDSEGIADILSGAAGNKAGADGKIDFAAEMKKIALTDAEIAQAKELGAGISDGPLAVPGQLFYQKVIQARKLKEKLGYQPCEHCGALVEPGERLCYDCYRKGREATMQAIRQVLSDMPWARIGDVKKHVPECTTYMLNHERAAMVHTLCSRVMVGDDTSVDAMTLVMLYKCLSPQQLTQDVITRTIYELRFALVKPPDYHAPRRYDVIKLGKKGKGEK